MSDTASARLNTPVPPSSHHVDSSHAELARGIRFVLAVVSIATLSVALPTMLVTDIDDVGRSEAWVITLLLMVWAGIRLSLVWVRGVPRLFDFFFWLFVYIFMGLAPTAQIRSGLVSTTTPGMDSALDMPTAGIVALGVACYEIGRLVWILLEHRRIDRGEPVAIREVDKGRAAILLAVALVLSAYVISQLGVTVFLGSREASSAAREAAWPDPALRGLIYASGVFPLLVAVGALTQVRRTASSPGWRRFALISAIGGAGVLLLIVNPVTSARYTFGTIAFALLVFAGAVATTRRARLTMMATIVGFLFLFPIADAFRRTEVRVSRSGFFDEYLSNPDYDAFWQIANAFSFWLDGLVVPFNQFLGSVFFWVPRAVWADKPQDTGTMLADYRGYTFGNLSAPTWAEALVNGGIAGVIIVFLIAGMGLRAMDGKISVALEVGGLWAIVGAILPVYTTILLRGSLLQATGALILVVACVLFVGAGRSARSGPNALDVRPVPLDRPTKAV